MPSTVQTTAPSSVVPCKALEILAEPTELRCTSCYHWYNPVPNDDENIKLPRGKPFLKRWAKRLVRDHCPKCRQEMVDLALAKTKKDSFIKNQEEEPESSTLTKEDVVHQQKLRRREAARDVKLYQGLIDTGAHLPPLAHDTSSWSDDDNDHPTVLLSRQQERGLLRELQRRGAFDYPGMGEGFRAEFGEFISDDEKYRQVKKQGCKWHVHKGWVSERGRKVTFKQPEKRKKCRRQPEARAKVWGSNMRVSGRMLPPRLDLEKSRLETINEAEEENQAEVSSPVTNFHATTASSTALEIKRDVLSNAARSSPQVNLARLPNGILHTFQTATIRGAPVSHPLQSLGGTIERVNKGTLTSRLRGKALLKELQEKDKSGVLRKIMRRVRR